MCKETAPPLAPIPRLLGTTELVQRLEAAPHMTQQCQLSATVTDQSAVGIGATAGMIIGGPVVIAATGRGSGPTTNQALVPPTGSHPPLKRQGSPLLQHKDNTPMFHSSNGSRTRNRYPASRPSRCINSLAGHTSPLAGGWAPFCLRHDDCLKKGVPHCFKISPFFLSFLFLSLCRDRETGHFEGVLRSEGNGPRALLLIRGSKVAPHGVRRPPQSTRAPSPLLIRGSKAGPSKGFDSCPRTCRVNDDPGYVRYLTKAWAALPRYPKTFSRPAGMICNGIPPKGGTESSDPIEWVRVQQITCRYFWSAPLVH
jgi:hypothetical protein